MGVFYSGFRPTAGNQGQTDPRRAPAKIFWQDDGVDRCAHILAATVSDDARLRIFDHDSAVMVPFGVSSGTHPRSAP